jgi:hypothetical protein
MLLIPIRFFFFRSGQAAYPFNNLPCRNSDLFWHTFASVVSGWLYPSRHNKDFARTGLHYTFRRDDLKITFKDGVVRGFAPFEKRAGDAWLYESGDDRNILIAKICPPYNSDVKGNISGTVTSSSGTWEASADFSMRIFYYTARVSSFQHLPWHRHTETVSPITGTMSIHVFCILDLHSFECICKHP